MAISRPLVGTFWHAYRQQMPSVPPSLPMESPGLNGGTSPHTADGAPFAAAQTCAQTCALRLPLVALPPRPGVPVRSADDGLRIPHPGRRAEEQQQGDALQGPTAGAEEVEDGDVAGHLEPVVMESAGHGGAVDSAQRPGSTRDLAGG